MLPHLTGLAILAMQAHMSERQTGVVNCSDCTFATETSPQGLGVGLQEKSTAAPKKSAIRVLNLVGDHSASSPGRTQDGRPEAAEHSEPQDMERHGGLSPEPPLPARKRGGDESSGQEFEERRGSVNGETDTLEPHRAVLPPVRARVGAAAPAQDGPMRGQHQGSGDNRAPGERDSRFSDYDDRPPQLRSSAGVSGGGLGGGGQMIEIEDDGSPLSTHQGAAQFPLRPAPSGSRLGPGDRFSADTAASHGHGSQAQGRPGSADRGSVDYHAVEADARAESRMFQARADPLGLALMDILCSILSCLTHATGSGSVSHPVSPPPRVRCRWRAPISSRCPPMASWTSSGQRPSRRFQTPRRAPPQLGSR